MNAPERDRFLPENVEKPDDLVSQLDLLRRRAARGTGKQKVSLDDLVAGSGVPRSTLGTYLNGTSFPPADVLDAVVIALRCPEQEQRAWAEAWERASAWLSRQREQEQGTTYSQLFQTEVPIADKVDPDHSIRDRPTRLIALHEHGMIGPDRRKAWIEHRETMRAMADGADRSILLIGPNPQVDLASVEISHLVNCTHGNTRFLVDPPILAIELRYDRPLVNGETYLLEYRVNYAPAYLTDAELAAAGLQREDTFEELRGFRKPGPVFTQQITFQPDDVPLDVRQVFLEHQQDPGRDVGPVPVNSWATAHIAIEHPVVGVHGIRWTWPS